jgi:hypothetical protein
MITKSLERLVQDDMITSKTFGKMTIYVVTQELVSVKRATYLFTKTHIIIERK